MQFQKEDIRENIISAARKEFRENGFEKASIRSITTAANTSKSNIYNYFQNKDALFAAVVEPTITGIHNGVEMLRARNSSSNAQTYSIEGQKQVIIEMMSYVFAHQDDLKLLLFRSSGSSLSDFKESVTRELAEVLSNWVSFEAPDKEISGFFVQMVAGFYISAIEQVLANDMSAEQAAGHFNEFLRFVYGGWKSVL